MGLSHPMGLKVADLSNRRMTSFTHYRTVISPDRYRRPLRIVNKAFSRECPAYIRNKLHP